MSFTRYTSSHRAFAERAARAPQQIDLSPDEWEEVGAYDRPIAGRNDLRTIASFWLVAVLLLAVIAAAPAVQAAVHHLV